MGLADGARLRLLPSPLRHAKREEPRNYQRWTWRPAG